ncbi:MAG: DDE-type integrase/transposase/recombinase, partial [Elusimicrobiota bacterium]|nr:DDE-type integrase/transposase/recombinase [Elusimicrobiota bacterium]
ATEGSAMFGAAAGNEEYFRKREEITMAKDDKALFRYRLIAPLLDPELKRGDKKAITDSVAEKIHVLPSGKEVKYSPETIRSWYRRFKKGGYDALKDKPRNDRGSSRALPEEVIRKACDLKIEVPRRTITKIIDILEREGIAEKGTVKKSTLHRVFQRKHLTSRVPKEKGYWQRFQAEKPNDLWQSDQMYGPYLPAPDKPGKTRRTHLLAFIDDASRVICHGEFFFEAKTPNLEHCLYKAIQKMGIPKKIYVDNGQIYSSKQLARICSSLGIRLMFARPYSPEGKGKIERFFGYVRSSFLPEVKAGNITTLDKLNEAFRAWLELKHHQKMHSRLKKKPISVFMEHKDKIRYSSAEELKEAFLYEEKRKVHKDCTFQLFGNYYEVLPALVGRTVEIRYDPFDTLNEVRVYLAKEFFQQARVLREPPRRRRKNQTDKKRQSTGIDYLKSLVDEHRDLRQDSLFGPRATSDDRFTVADLLTVMKRKGFHLKDFEKKEIQKCFDTCGPFDRNLTYRTLENLVKLKGTKQHISFYLDKIAQAKRKSGG